MRPSIRLISLIIVLAAITLIVAVWRPDWIDIASLAWAGLIGVCALDLMLSGSSKSMRGEFDMAAVGFTNSPTPFDLILSATKGNLPSQMEVKFELDDALALNEAFPKFGGETAVQLKANVDLTRRGVFKILRAYFMWPSKFGLFEILSSIQIEHEIKVIPNITPITSGEIETQLLPMLDGIKDFNKRGEGSEFHQLKEFVPGMDTRSIDWKRSARQRVLVAKETRAERNHQVVIGVDHGHLMSQSIGAATKLDMALNASLALCWAGGLGGDQVGFYSFASKPGRFVPPRPGREAFPILRQQCADLDYIHSETNHTWGLSQLNSKLSRRSLVVIFSDFVDSNSASLILENLAVLKKQHLVLYVTLRDPTLDRLIETHSIDMDDVAQSVAASQLKMERMKTMERMRQMGVLVLDVSPNELTTRLISQYMDIKMQELI